MKNRRRFFSLFGVGSMMLLGVARANETRCSGARYVIYKDSGGDWRWRLKAGNGETIAEHEGYSSRSACKDAVERLRSAASSAPVSFAQDCE